MSTEKDFSQQAINSIDAKKIINAISAFYDFANASAFIEVNNDLLNAYIERCVEEQNQESIKSIQDVVFMVNFQNQFIVALKDLIK